MEKALKLFEKWVSVVMIVVAMIYIGYLLLDLLYNFIERLTESVSSRKFIVEEKGTPLAATFFSILLLMEIIQTIKVYAEGHQVKARVIMIVCLIAVARKILMLDIVGDKPIGELAIAALILVLSVGYYLVSRSEK